MPEFRILVVDTPKCIKLLEYIDKHVEDIVRCTKYFVEVIKLDASDLDEETSKMLKSRGITGMPVLIAPNEKVIPGAARIMNVFDGQITTSTPLSTRPFTADLGSNPELSNFYAKEMFTVKNGALEKRSDSDDANGEGADADIDRKMREYRTPAHHKSTVNDIGNPQGGRNALDNMLAEALDNDNVGPPQQKLSDRYGVPAGGDVDTQMMNAWLNKTDGVD